MNVMRYEYMAIYEMMIIGIGLECLSNYNESVIKFEG